MKMTGRLLRNLFSGPETGNYPQEPREYDERTRGHVEFDPSDCILCNICGKKCPTNAITVDKKARTVTVRRMSCIQCGYCADSCPKHCITMMTDYTPPSTEKVSSTVLVPEREKKEEKKEPAK